MDFSVKFRKLKKREAALVLFAAAFALAAACFWAPLSREVLTRLLLWSDAPAEQVIEELVATSRTPASLLERLWQTDKIPHRLLALRSLARHLSDRAGLYENLQPLLLSADRDADLEVRTLALEILAVRRHPDLAGLARAQLDDADPAARVLGLRLLQKTRHLEWVPIVMPLLDDPDPRVVVSAAIVLGAWTGRDFGIRLVQARPEFSGPRAPRPADFDFERIGLGVQRWKDWWNEHRNEYAKPREERPSEPSAARLSAADFALTSLKGRKVRLADFRGQVVLLSFWDTRTQESLDQLPALIELQRRNPQRVVVLGISLDPAAPACDHEHGHDHEHACAAHAKPDLNQTRVVLRETVERQGLNFPILIDADGSVGRRYGIEELPTHGLIDPGGMIRRRFVGGRGVAVFEAMIGEIAAAKEHAAQPTNAPVISP